MAGAAVKYSPTGSLERLSHIFDIDKAVKKIFAKTGTQSAVT